LQRLDKKERGILSSDLIVMVVRNHPRTIKALAMDEALVDYHFPSIL
jgi:hypothetical protein